MLYHVFMKHASSVAWAVMENHGYAQVKDLPSHKYLLEKAAVFTNYFSVVHPSGPNYRALACGDIIVPGEEFRGKADSIASVIQTQTIHLTDGDIAWRHNPYLDTGANPSTVRATKMKIPLWRLIDHSAPHIYFGWDDLGNGHSASLEVADKNLTTLLTDIENSTWFNTSVAGLYPVFMFVWDEDLSDARNQVFAAMYGKGVKPGLYDTRHDHYDFNRTMTTIYDIPALGHTQNANSMIEVFNV